MKLILNISAFIFWANSMLFASEFGVMTLNVKNAFSVPSCTAVKTVLDSKSLKPDFILLQEMKFRKKGQSTVADYAELLGYTSFTQVKRIEDSEGLGILSDHAIMVDSKTKSPCSWYINLKARSSYTRVALITDFFIPKLGRVRVVNTHLSHKKDKKTAVIRRKQVEEIMEWLKVKQKEVPADIFFLGGDFNSNPSEPFYQGDFEAITQKPIAKGVFFIDNNGAKLTSDDKRRIDFLFSSSVVPGKILFVKEDILFDKEVKLSKNKSVKVSDHRAVLHTYALSEMKPAKTEKAPLAKL